MLRFAIAGAVVATGCGRLGFSDQARDAATDATDATGAPPDAELMLPGLVVAYRMEDEPSDGIVDDATGKGHDGRCVTSVSCPTSTAGKRGGGLQFDGSQYVRVTYGPWLATPTGFTIAAWVYLDEQIDQVAFAKPYSTGSYDSWDFVAWSPAAAMGTCFETVDAAMVSETVCGPELPAGQWFHVAGRWDGTRKALFVDGTKIAELAATVSMIDDNDMLFGADSNAGTPAYFWHGRIDDLEVYDRGLRDDEIELLHARR